MTKKDLILTTAVAAALLSIPFWPSSDDDWGSGDVVSSEDTAVCVDDLGRRVADDQCNNSSQSGRGGVGSGFFWYYLGRSSALPYYGDSVRDTRFAQGSYQPRAGANYYLAPVETRMSRSEAVSRGGLGSSGRRFGFSGG